MEKIIITGGAGFIGSHVVRLFVNKYPDYKIINLDKLTYAGNLANLKDIEDKPNYMFVKVDICDFDGVLKLMQDEKVDGIIHLAAESHVDRSIKDPFTFAQTNVMGTLSLLQAAKAYWESLPEKYEGKRFYHISTDEVYGALQMTHPEGIEPPFTTKASSGKHHLAYGEKFFTEDLKYQPHSPYSAAKASSDHFVRAFHDTFGMPTIVTNCSNNYGPYQFPEKLIPLFINNIRHRKPLPVYGKGENVRDWLYVVDHARAIDTIFHNGKIAETYNIGGFNEWKNIDIIKVLINTVDRLLGRPEGADMDLITYVTDRAGHDLRYAIDSTKLQKELGWEPSLQFEEGIEKTVKWYLDNQEWLDNVTSGEYQNYYDQMYNSGKKFRINYFCMEQQRYYWIDACKTFGLLLVILGHGRLFPESYQQFIYSFHMPLFFVLSGLLYKYKTTKETIKHDVYRLIIPYFLISFICLLIQFSLLFSQGGISLNEICKRVLGIFFVACYTGQFPPASGPTWFIITLFFVRILLSLKDSKWYRLGLTIISIIAFLLFKKKGFDPWLPIDTALMAIPFVTVGISLKPMRDHNYSKNKYLVGIISIVLMIGLLLVFNSYNGLVDMSWCSYGNSIIVFYLNGFLGTLALLIICRLLPMGGGSF